MIRSAPRRQFRIGDLCMVSALGRGGVVPDMHVPAAEFLQVIIADAKDPTLRGKRFTVRALTGYIRDHERHWSDLIHIEAYGMRIAEAWRNWNGLPMIRVDHDASLEPEINPHTGKPHAWGSSLYGRMQIATTIERQTSVGEDCVPFIRLPAGMAFMARAA